jgi:hypothetical protein
VTQAVDNYTYMVAARLACMWSPDLRTEPMVDKGGDARALACAKLNNPLHRN